MAISNMALFGGAFFTPIIVGKITHTLGWQWSFYFIAIFAGALFPLIFFFVPETAFRRAEYLNTDVTGETESRHAPRFDPAIEMSNSSTPDHHGSLNGSDPRSFEKKHRDAEVRYLDQDAIPKKVSFARTLLPFNGRKTDDNFFKLIIRPFPLFLHPAILWGCLIQGTLIGWTVMIGVVLAAVFLGPPLFFDEVQTGYMYTGAFIGAIVGFLLAGVLADWSTKLMIRRNKGVYEPEFRIVLVIAQLIIGCTGLYGFGITSANIGKYGWVLPDLFFGFEVAGMVIGAVASALYIVDAHREQIHHQIMTSMLTVIGDIAVEAFTCLLIFKNIFSFGLTTVAYNWLLKAGILNIFLIVGSVQVGICLLSIPMCKSITDPLIPTLP